MYARPHLISLALPLLAAGLCASVAVQVWQRRDELGAPWLLTLIAAVGVLNAGGAWGSILADPQTLLELARFTAVMEATAALGASGFALGYSGLTPSAFRNSWLPAAGLLALGLGTAAGLAGSDLVLAGLAPISSSGEQSLMMAEPAPGLALTKWLVWSGVGLATLVVLTHLAQAPGHWRERVTVVAAPALLAVGATLTSLGEGGALSTANPVHVAAALAACVVGHVLIGDQPAGAEPVARSAVVEEMDDAVMVLGRDGRIVDVNRAARDQLGLEVRGPLPFQVATLWASSWDTRERGVSQLSTRLELELVYGNQAVFELTMTPLGPRAGRNRTVLVLRDITEREKMERELRRATDSLRFLANTDGLTGLANRRCFEERLREEVERAQRYHRPLALVLLDLDHFKNVNDTWGHPAGDRVLRGTASAIQSVLREMDVAGRIGGEELAVLLPEADEAGALALAERLRLKIKESVHRSDDDQPFHVTASLGVTWLETGEEHDAEVLLSTGDQALYEAKVGGRDRVISKQVPATVGMTA